MVWHGGTISLRGELDASGNYRLICEDAGRAPGSPTVEPSSRSGLGLRLIANSVRQINGTLVTSDGPAGYRTEIEIPAAAA